MRSRTLRPSFASSVQPVHAMALGVAGALLLAAPAALSAQQQADREAAPRDTAEHEVEDGDTLWDLAGKYLDDPFAWQEIYRINQDVVEDPHWIYPGEVLRLPGGRVVRVTEREEPEDTVQEETEDEPEEEPREEPQKVEGDPFEGASIFDRSRAQGVELSEYTVEEDESPALVSPSDFYSASFVADWTRVRPRGQTGRVIRQNPLGLEMPPTVGRHADVMIEASELPVRPGDTLQAIHRGPELSERQDVVHSRALLQVTKVGGDSVRARVLNVFGSYSVGDFVIPAESFPARDLRRLEVAEEPITARVIGLEEPQALVGTNDRVFLDAGSDAGLSYGDELVVFPTDAGPTATADADDRLGVVRVVRVRPETSTVRVVETREVGIQAGVPAVLLRRAAFGSR